MAASGIASGAAAGSALGPWGTVIGGLIGAFATKKKAPKVAPFTPTDRISAAPQIDAQAAQRQAISGNIAAEDDLESLLSKSNRFQQGQASDLLEQAVPGYRKLSASIAGQVQQKSDHPYDLPPEVQRNLERIAAEKGIKVGTSGQTRQFSALRDIGVNMLDYGNQNFQQALQGLTTLTGVAPRVSPMSPLSFMVTPGQNIDVAGRNVANERQTAMFNTGVDQANKSGAQGTKQAGYNVEAAAGNWNNQNMWDNLVRSLSAVPEGGFDPLLSLLGVAK